MQQQRKVATIRVGSKMGSIVGSIVGSKTGLTAGELDESYTTQTIMCAK
jgi:hypothetical protein